MIAPMMSGGARCASFPCADQLGGPGELGPGRRHSGQGFQAPGQVDQVTGGREQGRRLGQLGPGALRVAQVQQGGAEPAEVPGGRPTALSTR
jgi:hypothetical protein